MKGVVGQMAFKYLDSLSEVELHDLLKDIKEEAHMCSLHDDQRIAAHDGIEWTVAYTDIEFPLLGLED